MLRRLRRQLARPERRRSPRFATRFDTLVGADDREGAGTLTELSYAGALLEDASLQPPVGSRVRLYVFVQPVAPFELEGEVTRHTAGGFAIACNVHDRETRRLVDALMAQLEAAAAG